MNDHELKPNSHKYRAAQQNEPTANKQVQKVVSGQVKTKKNELRNFKDVFISDDVKNVKSYILFDVLIPAVKNAIVDIVTDGVHMIFFGGSAPRRGGSSIVSKGTKVSYSSMYDRRGEASRPATARYSYDDITIDNRGEAEQVLRQMCDLIDTYGVVTVADLYDLVGVTGDYTDNKYGWTNLGNARIVRTRDGGYLIDLPKALPIN
jgi:hypothetical protein